MRTQDALNILGIMDNNVDDEVIKQSYRRAAQKYHPDRNPAGLQMMQMVNLAYESLRDFEKGCNSETGVDYGESLNKALNSIINLGLDIEVCGAWVWISGDTKPHREILKANGFRWAPKKLCWYFRPDDYKSFNRGTWSLDKIRETYGSNKASSTKQLAFNS